MTGVFFTQVKVIEVLAVVSLLLSGSYFPKASELALISQFDSTVALTSTVAVLNFGATCACAPNDSVAAQIENPAQLRFFLP